MGTDEMIARIIETGGRVVVERQAMVQVRVETPGGVKHQVNAPGGGSMTSAAVKGGIQHALDWYLDQKRLGRLHDTEPASDEVVMDRSHSRLVQEIGRLREENRKLRGELSEREAEPERPGRDGTEMQEIPDKRIGDLADKFFCPEMCPQGICELCDLQRTLAELRWRREHPNQWTPREKKEILETAEHYRDNPVFNAIYLDRPPRGVTHHDSGFRCLVAHPDHCRCVKCGHCQEWIHPSRMNEPCPGAPKNRPKDV